MSDDRSAASGSSPRPFSLRKGSNQGTDPLGSDRVRALAVDIAFRLRTVCRHLPEGELVKLATQMALVEFKYVRSSSPTQPLRRRGA